MTNERKVIRAKVGLLELPSSSAMSAKPTDAIEEALHRHRQPLLRELSVAFFDTTSLYFEGRGGATLGQRGFSKDYRPQLHQVVLGIVLDGHDRPIASFVWPGNTADVTTLLPVVERLRTRFGIARACVVTDRGMISAERWLGKSGHGDEWSFWPTASKIAVEQER